MGYATNKSSKVLTTALWEEGDLEGTGKMAQWVKCFLLKHEYLSLDSQHPHKSCLWLDTSLTTVLEDRDRQTLGAHQLVSLAKTMSCRFRE